MLTNIQLLYRKNYRKNFWSRKNYMALIRQNVFNINVMRRLPAYSCDELGLQKM